jgi:hypothetical protein
MTHPTAPRPFHANPDLAPEAAQRERTVIAPASRIDRNTFGLVAGIATILAVKISMLWVALQPF